MENVRPVIVRCSSGDAVNTGERKVVSGFTVTLGWTGSLHSEPCSSAAYGFSKRVFILCPFIHIYTNIKCTTYINRQTLILKLFGSGLPDTPIVIHKQY